MLHLLKISSQALLLGGGSLFLRGIIRRSLVSLLMATSASGLPAAPSSSSAARTVASPASSAAAGAGVCGLSLGRGSGWLLGSDLLRGVHFDGIVTLRDL
jgi:hypothetical protein